VTELPASPDLHRTVALVALLNLGYFAVEFSSALAIGSVSLFADSVDFLEDASVNLLILLALGWSLRARSHVGMFLAAVLLVPSLAALWAILRKFGDPVAPEAAPLTLVGFGALIVNLGCAFLLARFRREKGSLTKAAFLSARNDVLANIAIIAAGVATAATASHWPDLAVGIGIALMNANAAWEVWEAARRERDGAAA